MRFPRLAGSACMAFILAAGRAAGAGSSADSSTELKALLGLHDAHEADRLLSDWAVRDSLRTRLARDLAKLSGEVRRKAADDDLAITVNEIIATKSNLRDAEQNVAADAASLAPEQQTKLLLHDAGQDPAPRRARRPLRGIDARPDGKVDLQVLLGPDDVAEIGQLRSDWNGRSALLRRGALAAQLRELSALLRRKEDDEVVAKVLDEIAEAKTALREAEDKLVDDAGRLTTAQQAAFFLIPPEAMDSGGGARAGRGPQRAPRAPRAQAGGRNRPAWNSFSPD